MNDKFFLRLVWVVSAIVLAVVVLLKLVPAPAHMPAFINTFPHIIGGINATCSVLLIASLVAIKKGNIDLHKKLNLSTFFLSSIFLIFYIVFHYYHKDTLFGDANGDGVLAADEKSAVGSIRYVYYFILASHIILAAGVLPLILITFYRGLNMQVPQHKKIARWAYPIWLYVAVTGVVVYLMISPYYNF